MWLTCPRNALVASLLLGSGALLHAAANALPPASPHAGGLPQSSAVGLSSAVQPELVRRQSDKDPTKFTWVRRMAAVGDSFTAGVGSGSQLGSLFHGFNSWKCSRYDQSYPMLIKNYLGSNVDDFQYPACSGDQSWQIHKQIEALKGEIDLVTLTAGGNDLCLPDIILRCVVFSFWFEQASCDSILELAQKNVDNIMEDSVKQLIRALSPKMRKDGIVVYNSYARYFHEGNEDCSTKQDWGWFYWVHELAKLDDLLWWAQLFGVEIYQYVPEKVRWVIHQRKDSIPMTIGLRKKFNKLTTDLNGKIRKAVNDLQGEVPYKLGFSNWDLWGVEGVEGQYCHPKSSGKYPDPDQPDLLFFKWDTRATLWKWPPIQISKREVLSRANGTVTVRETHDDGSVHVRSMTEDQARDAALEHLENIDQDKMAELEAALPSGKPRRPTARSADHSLWRSSLFNSVNPRAAALAQLDRRAPAIPGCPGDPTGVIPGLGIFVPDMWGRYFHPNEKGHNAIASFAILKTMDLRAKVLGVEPEVCVITDEFRCWQKDGRKGYATANRLDKHMKIFCDELETPSGGNTVGWERKRSFDVGTPDEHEFKLSLSERASQYNKAECHESMKRIVHGCDGNDPNNPMNWKFGGKWKREEYTYEVNIKRDNRPFPPPKSAGGDCYGKYKFIFSSFELWGRGWSSWDHGQETILPNTRGCLGNGVTNWNFEYFDKPDESGWEWKAWFNTPVFVTNRCFKNNKVAFASGGFTDGCRGDSGA